MTKEYLIFDRDTGEYLNRDLSQFCIDMLHDMRASETGRDDELNGKIQRIKDNNMPVEEMADVLEEYSYAIVEVVQVNGKKKHENPVDEGWENYGDMNPLDHGGFWIKRMEGVPTEFSIVTLDIMSDSAPNKYLISTGYVDIEDSWIDWEGVRSTMDTREGAEPIELARDVFEYHGSLNCGGDTIGSPNLTQALRELKAHGIIIAGYEKFSLS
jgi:hypothetical protein